MTTKIHVEFKGHIERRKHPYIWLRRGHLIKRNLLPLDPIKMNQDHLNENRQSTEKKVNSRCCLCGESNATVKSLINEYKIAKTKYKENLIESAQRIVKMKSCKGNAISTNQKLFQKIKTVKCSSTRRCKLIIPDHKKPVSDTCKQGKTIPGRLWE